MEDSSSKSSRAWRIRKDVSEMRRVSSTRRSNDRDGDRRGHHFYKLCIESSILSIIINAVEEYFSTALIPQTQCAPEHLLSSLSSLCALCVFIYCFGFFSFSWISETRRWGGKVVSVFRVREIREFWAERKWSEEENEQEDGGGFVPRCDSVRRKRKRKMNKHKIQKLRKRDAAKRK